MALVLESRDPAGVGVDRRPAGGRPIDPRGRPWHPKPLLHHQRWRPPALSRGRATHRPHDRAGARLDHAGLDLAAADPRLRPHLPCRGVRSARPGRVRNRPQRLRHRSDAAAISASCWTIWARRRAWWSVGRSACWTRWPRSMWTAMPIWPDWCWSTTRWARSRRQSPASPITARRCRTTPSCASFVRGMFRTHQSPAYLDQLTAATLRTPE